MLNGISILDLTYFCVIPIHSISLGVYDEYRGAESGDDHSSGANNFTPSS